jgi:type I restriction-modification system DNA methylase subunit
MINPKQLLSDLQRLLKKLEDDLRLRCTTNKEIDSNVRAEYTKARSAGRISIAYEVWRDEFITQVAVAWILGCVFVRFLEDNQLIDTARLAGPTKERLDLARDHHTIYFREHPTESDREYLAHVFREAARLPGVKDLFNEQHNPLWRLGTSGDGASMLLNFWQQIDPNTGALAHDFTDAEWNTRFLGDLYQDLSESARKRYALVQTPNFVEEFILDRTLTPAIDEFGYQGVRLIDPACGSGHFLLGAFGRLFDLWLRNEPGTNPQVLAQNSLNSVFGIDLNPYAAAIARFRLLLAALKSSDVLRMKDAPDFQINVAIGDSLLHGEHPRDQLKMLWHPMAHVYETEDKEQLDHILKRGHYHAVVGNPPYITVKDAALNTAYRERFRSCHMKYSLAVPFMERFFDLAIEGYGNGHHPAGFVGMITANSFMKREFGKKLIESYIPRCDLTHVIDSAGAYIPGYATPTVILFARKQQPILDTIRTVMGIKGEPSTPDDSAKGLVWSAILHQLDLPGSESEFISVADMKREGFHKHPWSIGGGGATELKTDLDKAAHATLGTLVKSIGITSFTLEDDVFILPEAAALRRGLSERRLREMVEGEVIRDWQMGDNDVAIFPYDSSFVPIDLEEDHSCLVYLWPARTSLAHNKMFGGKTKIQCGLKWYEYGRLTSEKLRTPLSIAFASVVTHNHFVLDRGGKVFKQSAPIIKMQFEASEHDHLALLALLNSCAACFWMKQVFYPKGTTAGDISVEKGKPEANRYDFAATGMLAFPMPVSIDRMHTAVQIAKQLDSLARDSRNTEPSHLMRAWSAGKSGKDLETLLQRGNHTNRQMKRRMVVLQEELDWEVYRLFGLSTEGADMTIVSAHHLGAEPRDRPCYWSNRESPDGLAAELRKLYTKRRNETLSSQQLDLIEKPTYKRPWLGQQGVFGHTTTTYEERIANALRSWLLNWLEDSHHWSQFWLISAGKLADRVRQDKEFMQVAEMYRGRGDFDLAKLVGELVESEAVPFLPVLTYKQAGLRKRALWEQTWELQRQEDAIDARMKLPESDPEHLAAEQAEKLKSECLGEIAVPPKYKSTDFQVQSYWRLRGKLDVPKERFISYPYCERDADPSLVIAWAGWDHLQQAQALAAYYESVRSNEGWSTERLIPLLAGLLELVPWLLQWYNEIDPHYNQRMGDFFKSFVEEEARSMNKTIEEIRGWKP